MKYVPETKEELQALCEDSSIYLGDIDTCRITDMSHLFEDSERKNFAGIEDWDVSNVVDMSYMFSGAEAFNQQIGNWNVSNVVVMNNMFDGAASFKQDLSAWELSSHVDDYEAFYNSGMGKDLVLFPKHCVEHYISENPDEYTSEQLVAAAKKFAMEGFGMKDEFKKALSVKEQLIALGMKEEDFSRHESDLYVRVTPVSQKFLETYPFKKIVQRFIDNIEHVPFYDFPFAAMKEKVQAEKEEMDYFAEKYGPKKQQDSYSVDVPLDGLHNAFERFEDNGMEGLCGDWAVRKNISMQPGWWELSFSDQPVARCIPSEDFTRDGQIGYIKRVDERISDKNFSDICDIVQAVSPYCKMDPAEKTMIDERAKKQGR